MSDLAKPRVLFVTPVSYFYGGAERVLIELLANLSIEPVLAVPEIGELSAAAERLRVPVACYHPTALLKVHRPPRFSQIAAAVIDSFRCAIRLRSIARKHNCAVIHTTGLKAHALVPILGGLLRTKVIVHLHDIPITRIERIIWRTIAAFAATVIVVSDPCWPGRLGGKVVLLKNGMRLDSAELPQRLWQPDRPLRLGFIGRYHPYKGLDLMLDWVESALAADIPLSVVMRGRADPDHAKYWERICGRISSEGLEHVVVNEGWQPSGKVFNDIHFLLVPSDSPDPAPLVVLEAMRAGIVVIGYPAGGIPLLLPKGTGVLARTPEDFVNAIRRFIARPDLYNQVRQAAFQHVRIDHSPETFNERFATICKNTVCV